MKIEFLSRDLLASAAGVGRAQSSAPPRWGLGLPPSDLGVPVSSSLGWGGNVGRREGSWWLGSMGRLAGWGDNSWALGFKEQEDCHHLRDRWCLFAELGLAPFHIPALCWSCCSEPTRILEPLVVSKTLNSARDGFWVSVSDKWELWIFYVLPRLSPIINY